MNSRHEREKLRDDFPKPVKVRDTSPKISKKAKTKAPSKSAFKISKIK